MKSLLFSLALIIAIPASAPAQLLIAGSEATAVSSITPTDGYVLFTARVGPGFQTVTDLPSYVSAVNTFGNGGNSGVGFTGLNVDGTQYGTGISFVPTYIGESVPSTLASIVLTGNVPSSFTLGVLTDNIYLDGNTQLIITSTTDPTGVTYGSINNFTAENDIYYTTVTGAIAGETITIKGLEAGQTPEIGAVTFDKFVAAPEPSVLALLLLGSTFFIGFLIRFFRFSEIASHI